MRTARFVAGIVIVSATVYTLAAPMGGKVSAQPRAVELSVPRAWGRVAGVVGMNILFEAPDGTIREVSLVGGQATVVTLMARN